MSYHTPPPGRATAVDFLNELGRGLLKLVGITKGVEVYARGDAVFFVPVTPPKPRTRARDRTRSKRWQAGSKRTKHLARAARRRGRRSRYADPWKGWTDLGYTTDRDLILRP